MPNWCSNELEVIGDKKARDEFIARITNEDTSEHKYEILPNLFPCPEPLRKARAGHFTAEPNSNWANLLEKGDITQEWHDELVERNRKGYEEAQANIAQYGYSDWYEWCVKNWGTKWGDTETDLMVHDDDQTMLSFQSAWSPPVEGLQKISEKFPTLTFVLTYSEEGMDFYGVALIRNGSLEDNCHSISNIEGMENVDWNSEEVGNGYEKAYELVADAKDSLYSTVINRI